MGCTETTNEKDKKTADVKCEILHTKKLHVSDFKVVPLEVNISTSLQRSYFVQIFFHDLKTSFFLTKKIWDILTEVWPRAYYQDSLGSDGDIYTTLVFSDNG